MTRQLKPWAYGPFEILLHAEMHYRAGDDVDRRIAMIGFDNAIEVAISTYLNLHPIQRGNRSYASVDIGKWLSNYHTKVEFFFAECTSRGVTATTEKDVIIWYHEVRNGQYHVGGATIPQRRELDGVRNAALEVFSILFDEPDGETLLEKQIAASSSLPPPPRLDEHDRVIDHKYDMLDVCGRPEYVSDVLYALDPSRYRELALELQSGEEVPAKADDKPEKAE